MAKRIGYRFEIRALSAEEGGGFLISHSISRTAFPMGKPSKKRSQMERTL